MIRTILVIAIAALPVQVMADEPKPAPETTSLSESAPPPPGLNDPGVQTESAPRAVDAEGVALPKPDTRPVRDRASRSTELTPAEIEAGSDSVSERVEGSDTIREYRKNGILRMVRIQPGSGPVQTYIDANGDGRLDRDLIDGPVSPVYFSIYEWN